MAEPTFAAPLALTYDERDVMHDLLNSADNDTRPEYWNALHSLRIKYGLWYTAGHNIDVSDAVTAAEFLTDYAREHGSELRISWDHSDLSYTLRVEAWTWHGEELPELVERAANELRVKGGVPV